MSQWVQVMETVVRERRPALVGYAYLMIGSRSEAEDVVQEAIVKTFSRGKAQTSIREAEAYIKRAIANESINRSRKRMVAQRHAAAVVDSPFAPSHSNAVDARADVERALDALSPRERAVVVLKYMDDLTINTIAAVLKLNEGTVKRYLANAAVKLRHELGDDAIPAVDVPTVPVAVMERV